MLETSSRGDLVKFEALLQHLEESLSREAFYIAQRDSQALLVILPQLDEVFSVLGLLLGKLPKEKLAAVRERLEAVEEQRRANSIAVGEALRELSGEIGEVVQASKRLGQLRRSSLVSGSVVESMPLRGWA